VSRPWRLWHGQPHLVVAIVLLFLRPDVCPHNGLVQTDRGSIVILGVMMDSWRRWDFQPPYALLCRKGEEKTVGSEVAITLVAIGL
jgi:hypothetical protein